MATTAQPVAEICAQAKRAARELASLDTATKNAALEAMADALEQRTHEILEANARDMDAGQEAGLHSGLLDRLKLTEERVAGIARDVRTIATLPDPVGETIEGHRLENGLDVRRVRVPLGVVAVVYEARPNVTVDCSALCLKSGNAIVLRGSSTAQHSNAVLAQVASSAVQWAGIPEGAISIVSGGDRDELRQLATQDGARGPHHPARGRGPEERAQGARDGAGDVRVRGYLPPAGGRLGGPRRRGCDRRQREGAAAVGLQRDRDAAGARRRRPRSSCRVCSASCASRVWSCAWTIARARWPAASATRLRSATEEDWATEYHALILSVKVVNTLEEGIEHVNRYSSGHSEAIVTGSTSSAQAFTRDVDAAAVYVNASTRFTDGAVFGMGAEIGNSTQKLHARGPIGLRELTTYKFVIEGSGQVRE